VKQDQRFSEDIEKSARDLKKGRRERSAFWHYAYVLGVGGWLFAIPVVTGAYFGRYLDRKFGSGDISWTLTCMILGIASGIYNIWHFLMRRSRW
jgi:ATP synthase protein I